MQLYMKTARVYYTEYVFRLQPTEQTDLIQERKTFDFTQITRNLKLAKFFYQPTLKEPTHTHTYGHENNSGCVTFRVFHDAFI